MGNMCAKPPAYDDKADEETHLVEGAPPPYTMVPQGWVLYAGGKTGRIMRAVSSMLASNGVFGATLNVSFYKTVHDYGRVKAYFPERMGRGLLTAAHPLVCMVPSQGPSFVRILVQRDAITEAEGRELERMLNVFFEDRKLPVTVEL